MIPLLLCSKVQTVSRCTVGLIYSFKTFLAQKLVEKRIQSASQRKLSGVVLLFSKRTLCGVRLPRTQEIPCESNALLKGVLDVFHEFLALTHLHRDYIKPRLKHHPGVGGAINLAHLPDFGLFAGRH